MTRPRPGLPAVAALVSLLLVPTLLTAGPREDRERALRAEQRLGGGAARVVLLGFSDRHWGEDHLDCTGKRDADLPCVEEVDYADLQEPAAELRDRPTHVLTRREHALSGRLLHWLLSDIAFRTTAPPGQASASVDAGLWSRGATRLPAPESLWARSGLPLGLLAKARGALPEPALWWGSGLDAEPLCRPLVYGDDRGSPPTEPPTVICRDGFVANFTDHRNRPVRGDLFRHGAPERAAAGHEDHLKGEKLLTEYLFVSIRGDSPPWSNRRVGNGEVGLFRPPPRRDREPESDDTTGDERFAARAWLGFEKGDKLSDPTVGPRILGAAVRGFIHQIGVRMLGYATLEYNPTHVRTATALAALMSPPEVGEQLGETSLAGRNPGHRDEVPLGESGPGAGAEAGGYAGEVTGQLTVQLRDLPEKLRRDAITTQLPKAAKRGLLVEVLESASWLRDTEPKTGSASRGGDSDDEGDEDPGPASTASVQPETPDGGDEEPSESTPTVSPEQGRGRVLRDLLAASAQPDSGSCRIEPARLCTQLNAELPIPEGEEKSPCAPWTEEIRKPAEHGCKVLDDVQLRQWSYIRLLRVVGNPKPQFKRALPETSPDRLPERWHSATQQQVVYLQVLEHLLASKQGPRGLAEALKAHLDEVEKKTKPHQLLEALLAENQYDQEARVRWSQVGRLATTLELVDEGPAELVAFCQSCQAAVTRAARKENLAPGDTSAMARSRVEESLKSALVGGDYRLLDAGIGRGAEAQIGTELWLRLRRKLERTGGQLPPSADLEPPHLRGDLLVDHLVDELSTSLQTAPEWTPADLQDRAEQAFIGVLQKHGYPSLEQPLYGSPANPLAVCEIRTEEEGGGESPTFKPVEITVLFSASAFSPEELDDRWVDSGAEGDAQPLSPEAAWSKLWEARDQIPFIGVDAPDRTLPRVVPVFELAGLDGPPRATSTTSEEPPQAPEGRRVIYRASWRVWSGWHLLWGAHRIGPREIIIDQVGIVLRSAAICSDTLLVPAGLEPTVVRAALLRGHFEPTTPPERTKPGSSGQGADVEGKAKEVAEAQDAADDLLGQLGDGELPSWDAEDPDWTPEPRQPGPAADLAMALEERLLSHRGLTCSKTLDFGSVGVDDDGDGLTERAGDCNDRDPRWDTATLPAVVVAIDLTRGRSAPPSVRAPTPYLQLSERAPAHTFWMEDLTDRQIKAKKKEKRKKDREPEKEEAEAEEHEIEEVEEAGVEGEEKQVKKPASPPNPRLHHGSVWARSIIRSESEEGEEPRPIDFAPDHIRVGERWKRRTSPEFRMGVGLAWSPFAALSSRCDPDFDGISVSCPLGADGALIDEKRTTWDLTGNGVQGTFQAYVTTWGAGAARHGLDAGIELSLHLLVPGVWGPGNSDLLRLAQLRPTVSVLVGPRVLPLPALRVPRPGPAWGEPRFSRVELGLRAGWSTTALPDGVEGGPLVELWFGESLRSRGSRTPVSATMTPYRPKGLLGGFIRGELFMPVPSGGTGDRATYLHLGAVVSVGVRGSFALGMREVKESDVPDLESLERPGLPGLPGLGGGG